ncbi:MAG: hypothetical protein ABR508_00130 [Candidatus Baltobacteraceae bacterium]
MNGRFGACIVAFAVASALVSGGPMLPEFLLQLHDPNLLGGPLFAAALHTFGWAFVAALCAVLAGCAVLLAAWRTRARGATDWNAALAAALIGLCMSGRAGVSLDPIGWLCAAGCALLLERDDDRSSIALIALMLAWAALQGGATLGSILILCAVIGRVTDEGVFDARFRRRIAFLAPALVAGLLQLHSWPWHGYGAHALYLDALKEGAQRDRLWSADISASALGFAGVLTVAAWYGLRRRGRMMDAVTFFALLVLTLIDARTLPYFGIVAAPAAVDALASYYVLARSSPRGGALRYAPAALAACAVFIAAIAVTEPKVTMWPRAYGQPAALLSFLHSQRTTQRILCTHPRWCDGLHEILPRAQSVADDRAGIISRYALHVEAVVSNASPGWRQTIERDRVNTVIASADDSIVGLLKAEGWSVRAWDEGRVLVQPGRL